MSPSKNPHWYVTAEPLPAHPERWVDTQEVAEWLDLHAGVLRDALAALVRSEIPGQHRRTVIELEARLHGYAMAHAEAFAALSEEDRLMHLLSLYPVLELLGEGATRDAVALLHLRLGGTLVARLRAKAAGANAGDARELAHDALLDALGKIVVAPRKLIRALESRPGDPQRALARLLFAWAINKLRDHARRERRLVGLHVRGEGAERRPCERSVDASDGRLAGGGSVAGADPDSAKALRDRRVARESVLDASDRAHGVILAWEQSQKPEMYLTYALWMRHESETEFFDWIAKTHPGCTVKHGTFYRRMGELTAALRYELGASAQGRSLGAADLRMLRSMGAGELPPISVWG